MVIWHTTTATTTGSRNLDIVIDISISLTFFSAAMLFIMLHAMVVRGEILLRIYAGKISLQELY